MEGASIRCCINQMRTMNEQEKRVEKHVHGHAAATFELEPKPAIEDN